MAGTDSRQGFRSDAAFIRETTYGTVVAVTKKIPHLLAFLLKKSIADLPDESLVAKRGPAAMVAGEPMVKGIIRAYHSWGEMDPFIAAAIGGSTVVSAISPYEYLYEPTDDLIKVGADTKAHSFTAVHRLEASTNEIREYAGVKPHSWKCSGKVNAHLVDEFDCSAKARDDASATNGDTQMNAATAIGSDRTAFLSAGSVIRLGNLDDPLVAGDNVNPGEFEFMVDNKMAEDYGSEGLQEPEPENFPGISLMLQLPRLAVTTYRTWVDSKTRLQALLQFTHPTNANIVREIRCGAMTLRDDFGGEVEGPSLIRPKLTFDLHDAETDNPTWPAMVGAYQVYLKSTQASTDPFIA